MFCVKCGVQLQEGAKCCPGCGTAVSAVVAQTEPAAATPQAVQPNKAQGQVPNFQGAYTAPNMGKTEDDNSWAALLLVSLALYAVPETMNFLMHIFLRIVGYPFSNVLGSVYTLFSISYLACFIVGIYAIVKFKTKMAQSVYIAAIILLSDMAFVQFYYLVRRFITE